ncbi:hypothetical protein TCAL_00707 [Tigriopus californicus]|uniref:Uncharacterized protein n=1 Tax=Tigriopus californicus TaxID=6832 RepID=A0A553PCM3_TIGCA|nr:hypothetical protein TCAL_00707 [Tigriopus californicus]
MANSGNSHRNRSRHPRGRNKVRGLATRRYKVSRESRKQGRWAWREETRSYHDNASKNKERQRRRSRTPSSSPSPTRRSSTSKKSNRSPTRARARRSGERSYSESSEKSIDIIRPIRPGRHEPTSPIDLNIVCGNVTLALHNCPPQFPKRANSQEPSVLDKGVTPRNTETPIDSPSSPNPASEELYASALKAHGVPDGFQRMSLTFAGRISVVKDYSDSTCRKIALRMIQKWQQSNETYLSLSTRYLTNRKKEPEPDGNNNHYYGYNCLKTFPPMMKLRHELHDILASRDPRPRHASDDIHTSTLIHGLGTFMLHYLLKAIYTAVVFNLFAGCHHHPPFHGVDGIGHQARGNGHAPSQEEGVHPLGVIAQQDGLQRVVETEVESPVDEDTNTGDGETTVQTTDAIGLDGFHVAIDDSVELSLAATAGVGGQSSASIVYGLDK